MSADAIRLGRLVWQARTEGSRLHRLAVDSAREIANDHRRLNEADARIYRCPGCGDWRYDIDGIRRTCSACGHHRKNLRRTA